MLHVFINHEPCGIFDRPGVAEAVLQKSVVIKLFSQFLSNSLQFDLKRSHALTVKASELKLLQNMTSFVVHSDKKEEEKSMIGF